ncbi:MAG: hypothetical protein KDI31_00730 [Pseudomonadales bacterium]|nr:hypothetical protein [Pseudomonadales bacterium]
MMQARNLSSIHTLLDPAAAGWSDLPHTSIPLIPAPLGLQPTPYLRASWAGQNYGTVDTAHLACAHDGHRAILHLSWSCPQRSLKEGENFPDAAAIAFPVRGQPALVTMGSEHAPLHILQWQAGIDGSRSVLATGIGSSRPGPGIESDSLAVWSQGTWQLCITRSLAAAEGGAVLTPGSVTQIGIVIWNGANRERGGIKAFSLEWTAIELEASASSLRVQAGSSHE